MLKKFKKLFIVALCGVLLSCSVLSASAVDKISTGNVYMNGYKLYGTLTIYTMKAVGYTYCEKTDAGKSAQTYYAFYTTDNSYLGILVAGSSDYTYNNSVGLTVSTGYADSSIFDYYAGAMTISKVMYPNQTYYKWTSEGTDNELRDGIYINYD